jgi:uncharacterized membrane-anchored protein
MRSILRKPVRTPESGTDTHEVRGPARVGTRTKDLTKRLRPGDVAVIDHLDIDRVAGEALVAAAPAAVLNAARSTSGRYPNAGPAILLEAGIALVDGLGPGVMSLPEGAVVGIDEGRVVVDGEVLAEGTRQTPETVAASLAAAREGLSAEIESFAENTMTYLRRERDLLLDGVGTSTVATCSSSCAATTTARTSRCCARTSPRTGPCSWASTVAPTRSSTPAGSPT